MMFKKTIFVTVLNLLTAGVLSPNIAQAQNRAPVLGGLFAAACGAGAYNHASHDRGWATAGAALFCGIIGYAIGNEMDKASVSQASECLNSGKSSCSWTTSENKTVTVKRKLIENKQCYYTAQPFMTPQGLKNCVCLIDDAWVTTSVEEVDANGRVIVRDSRDSLDDDPLAREARLLERIDRIRRQRGEISDETSGGGSNRGAVTLSEREEEAYLRYYGRGSSARNERSSEEIEIEQIARTHKSVNGCIVTDAFFEAPFGATDDVCRQFTSFASANEALGFCKEKSATPSSCRLKN
ncbi:MAG: hypothetical protein IPM57_03360 [Oligoflexia bacterium]|nr:hypothetical protein [Oligoflexia bacterium]